MQYFNVKVHNLQLVISDNGQRSYVNTVLYGGLLVNLTYIQNHVNSHFLIVNLIESVL